jgi:glycosyltransferase involved in cell wall biosynthesis
MKVVQFLGSRGWGGLENVFVDLCNELSKRVEIDVIVFQESAVIKKFDKNVRIHILYSNSSRFNPLLHIELYTLLKKLKSDIVHTHGAKTTQIFYYLNKLLHIVHIATKHNTRKGKIFNKLQNVIAVSKEVSKSILSDHVKVIYNGIRIEKVLPHHKNKIFTILSVGRLDKVKGFDILIHECAKLDFLFNLQIVGEGIERENLEQKINLLHINDKVNLIGFRQDIPQLMQDADLVVVSSHSEGFSLVMIEALFYAKVLVTTKVGIGIEIFDNKFLIDDFDIATKINDIYFNYQEYEKDFSQLQQKLKNRFLLENIADKHIKYYNSIINDKDDNENT